MSELHWSESVPASVEQERQRLAAAIRDHPGTKAHRDVDQVLRGWNTFDTAGRNLYALMTTGEQDEEFAASLVHWQGVGRDAFTKASDSAVQAFLASLSALIDVTRPVVRRQPQELQDQYATRVQEVVRLDGAGMLRQLRNYVLHVGQVPWLIDFTINSGRASVAIRLDSSQLRSWSRWDAATKRWLACQSGIELGPVVLSYRNASLDLYTWLVEALQEAHAAEISGANDLVRQYNLHITDGRFEDQASFMAAIAQSVAEWRRGSPQEGGPGIGPEPDTADPGFAPEA